MGCAEADEREIRVGQIDTGFSLQRRPCAANADVSLNA